MTSVRILVTSAVALSLAASLAGGAEAAARKHKKRLLVGQYGQAYAGVYGYRYPDGGGYYEQRLEAAPVGSQQWWSIYERQRGGRR